MNPGSPLPTPGGDRGKWEWPEHSRVYPPDRKKSPFGQEFPPTGAAVGRAALGSCLVSSLSPADRVSRCRETRRLWRLLRSVQTQASLSPVAKSGQSRHSRSLRLCSPTNGLVTYSPQHAGREEGGDTGQLSRTTATGILIRTEAGG